MGSSKWRVCFHFHHVSPSYWPSTKGTGDWCCFWYKFFRLATTPLDFIMEHNASTSQHKQGRKCNQTKIPRDLLSLIRIRANCLVPMGELDTLLNGSLELALEVFQPLLLKVGELTQTKHFLHSILAEPYLQAWKGVVLKLHWPAYENHLLRET